MFYVRNGGGIRNCTLKGLTGALVGPNIYGTKRPTGGAFVSLDPGTGPTDTSVWIANNNKQYFTPSTATYDPATGLLVSTIPTVEYTPTDATYDPATGFMEVTIGAHSLTPGESITFDTESIQFRCALDNYESVKSYPSVSDPVYATQTKILAVSQINSCECG